MQTLPSRSPETGQILKEIPVTSVQDLPAIFEKARAAQARWAEVPLRKRAKHLLMIRETLLNHADQITEQVSKENGKPPFEVLSSEILPCLELITHFAQRAPKILGNQELPLRWLKHRKSILRHAPLGTVAVISPWNYPFMIPFSDIVLALLAGNAVIFKPSEVTPQTGLLIQEVLEESVLPSHLIQTIIGTGEIGQAIIEQRPAKVFFTGGVETGKKVMTAAAQHLIPVQLELGGKNAMIVFSDADLDFASSAALWGGLTNSGQVCGATSRLLVHESIVEIFTAQLTEKIKTLRPKSDDGLYELGFIAAEKQRNIYERHLADARARGLEIVTGGNFTPEKNRLEPTVIRGKGIEDSAVFQEETFGPILAISTFRTPSQAIELTNQSPYGLTASIITRNFAMAEEVAKKLDVGTVMINEVVYTAGLAETPWGGIKHSGFGRARSDVGLLEFVRLQHIHKPRSRMFTFKSPWWFPYTPFQQRSFRWFMELYRRHWTDKLRAFPNFLMNFVYFLKKEKRL